MAQTASTQPNRTSARGKWRAMAWNAGEAGAGSEAVGPELVGMVPQRILQEDEIVLLLTRPSLFFIFYMSYFFIIITLMVGALFVKLSLNGNLPLPAPSVIGTLTACIALGRLIWALLVWTSHTYMLTNLRVVTMKGVLNTQMFQTQLRRIQKTELYRPLIQRLCGTGTVGFATAAAAGTADSTWFMINRPVETQEMIVAAINKSR